MPYFDTPAMQPDLAEISAAVAPGAHGTLILDQAGWHLSHIPYMTWLLLPPRGEGSLLEDRRRRAARWEYMLAWT
jgi:hypothetical protein